MIEDSENIPDKFFEAVAEELEQGIRDKGLWLKVYSLSSGDESLSEARYAAMRAKKLMAEHQSKMQRERQLAELRKIEEQKQRELEQEQERKAEAERKKAEAEKKRAQEEARKRKEEAKEKRRQQEEIRKRIELEAQKQAEAKALAEKREKEEAAEREARREREKKVRQQALERKKAQEASRLKELEAQKAQNRLLIRVMLGTIAFPILVLWLSNMDWSEKQKIAPVPAPVVPEKKLQLETKKPQLPANKLSDLNLLYASAWELDWSCIDGEFKASGELTLTKLVRDSVENIIDFESVFTSGGHSTWKSKGYLEASGKLKLVITDPVGDIFAFQGRLTKDLGRMELYSTRCRLSGKNTNL